jgi:hypothetical protein
MSKQYLGIMLLLLCSMARAQEQKPSDQTHDMSGMPGMNQTEQKKEPSDGEAQEKEKDAQNKDESEKAPTVPAAHETPGAVAGSATAIRSMEGHHVDMGPHMKMTSLREMKPDDQEKAASVLQTARAVAAKYQDYKDALAEGYKIFLPNLPQKQYHFTNYWYGYEAGLHFNPTHPTSLLYEKHGDDYKLVGLMYTAPKHASEEELNSRIPLSIAQWHAHINLCLSPQDKKPQTTSGHPKFGLGGSITTKEACDAAGGKFMPQIFGWMVHVYPLEQKPEEIWSVERQAHSHMD